MALADMYIWAGMGQKMHGLIHNLNNQVHVMHLQVAMLEARSDSSGDEPLSGFKDKIAKFARSTSKIVDILQKNGQCSFFSQKSQNQINIRDYLDWLVEFWDNDLYFKHNISCELFIEDSGINLQIPPFYLTLCLEQGISNAVEAYQAAGPAGKHKLLINVSKKNKGMDLSISSFTEVPNLDPWLAGSSSKPGHLGMGLPLSAFLAGRMGWKIDLQTSSNKTQLMISIPDMKSKDPETA